MDSPIRIVVVSYDGSGSVAIRKCHNDYGIDPSKKESRGHRRNSPPVVRFDGTTGACNVFDDNKYYDESSQSTSQMRNSYSEVIALSSVILKSRRLEVDVACDSANAEPDVKIPQTIRTTTPVAYQISRLRPQPVLRLVCTAFRA